MKNGLYAVRFAAPGGVGGGVVTIRNDRVAGGDAGYAYVGEISSGGDQITGSIEVFQHEPGVPSVFGSLERYTLSGQGRVNSDGHASMTVTTPSAPGMQMQIALRFLQPV
jgi:hypothetical protein